MKFKNILLAMRNFRIKNTFGILLLSIFFAVLGGILIRTGVPRRARPKLDTVQFDGERAYRDIIHQTDMGARTPNSAAHAQARAWIRAELENAGWQVDEQIFDTLGHRGYNLIASHGEDSPKIILGAHYDNRIHADHDLDVDKRHQAVVGANDGASGVALLLELARKLPAEKQADSSPSVWLVFFDLEDNGNIPSWNWILGSHAFVDGYTLQPDAVVILDMIGDADLGIYFEKNSNPKLRAEIWEQAEKLGYKEYFIAEEKFSMLDDHTPFLEAGIPAVDVIDFNYPYWHTTEDTFEHVSAESLQIVGDTILAWLLNR